MLGRFIIPADRLPEMAPYDPKRLRPGARPMRYALLAAGVPFVEVHLTNVWAREPFRHHSLLSDIAVGVVGGFGADSYLLGMQALTTHLRTDT